MQSEKCQTQLFILHFAVFTLHFALFPPNLAGDCHPDSLPSVSIAASQNRDRERPRAAHSTVRLRRFHLRQRWFTLCSAVSMVLCAVTLALWVRSYHRGDQVGWYINRWDAGEGRFGAIGFDSDSGGIVFFLQRRESHLDLVDPADAVFRSDNPPLCEPCVSGSYDPTTTPDQSSSISDVAAKSSWRRETSVWNHNEPTKTQPP